MKKNVRKSDKTRANKLHRAALSPSWMSRDILKGWPVELVVETLVNLFLLLGSLWLVAVQDKLECLFSVVAYTLRLTYSLMKTWDAIRSSARAK